MIEKIKTPEELTADWKAGKLKSGWYYILNQINVIRIEQANVWIGRHEKPFVGFDDDSGIKEVIAPVPSYNEVQRLKDYEKTIQSYNGMPIDYTMACETVNKLLDEKDELKQQIRLKTLSYAMLEKHSGELGAENAKLKGLLKECQKYFEQENQHSFTSCFEIKYELLTKIEEALK